MRKLIKIDDITKEEWLGTRKKGIGGSDIAAIMGMNPFSSPLAVYLDKTDQAIKDDEENIPAELGLELEPYLSKKFIKWIKENEGLDIELKEMPYILQHDTIDYFLVNLDRYFEHPARGNCPVEFKTTTEFLRDKWREDQLPDQYFLQCQWQLMITGWMHCYIAFLIGNRTFDVKIIPRNEAIIENMKIRAINFWEENILANEPPAPIGKISDAEALKILYPEEFPGNEKILTEVEKDEVLKNLSVIDEQRAIEKEAKSKIETAQQIIKMKIGDNEFTQAGSKLITFKTVIVPERVVKQYTFRRLFIKNL